MGPSVPMAQAARKVLKGVHYLYGFPPSEQPIALNLNNKLRGFEKAKSWGDVSRAEWRDYVSLYPRHYQIRKVSRGRIEKWLGIGNNRATFQSWGPKYRAFLRTEQEDRDTNTNVRKTGIPLEATWLNEEHRKRGADFDRRMGRTVTAPVEEGQQDDDDGGDEAVKEEEERYQPPGGDEYESEDVEQPRNIKQRPNKRRRGDQVFPAIVGTPFPPTVLASLPPGRQVNDQSQQQFALVELRAAAAGFRALHSEILRVAQRLDPGDVLRSLLSSIAGSASLDVVRAEAAARMLSELVDYLATAHAEAARSDDRDQDMKIKRVRIQAAYEMLPVAPADHLRHRSQRRHARLRVEGQPPNFNPMRESQVPEAVDNIHSPTVPRGQRSLSYELPDGVVEGLRPTFERRISIHFGPLSSHRHDSSRPNTAVYAHAYHTPSRSTPAVGSNIEAPYHQEPFREFNPAITIDRSGVWNQLPPRHQPQLPPHLRRPAPVNTNDIPLYSVKGPSYQPTPRYQPSPYHQPPSQPPSIAPYAPVASKNNTPHAPVEYTDMGPPPVSPAPAPAPAPPHPFDHPPQFGVATRRTTRATSPQRQTQEQPESEPPKPRHLHPQPQRQTQEQPHPHPHSHPQPQPQPQPQARRTRQPTQEPPTLQHQPTKQDNQPTNPHPPPVPPSAQQQ